MKDGRNVTMVYKHHTITSFRMVICNRTKNNKCEMLYPNIMLDIQEHCF